MDLGIQNSVLVFCLSVCRDEMDLLAFTDFVLAWDHRSHPAAIKYFFPIIDIESKVLLCRAPDACLL